MDYTVHEKDLPDDLKLGNEIAVDCEMMGLNPHHDRLTLVQISDNGTMAHLVRIHKDQTEAPNLKKLLEDKDKVKIFHFARTDLQFLRKFLGIIVESVFCTKMASKLARTYTDRHGYKDICREMLGVEISKQQQLSDWGKEELPQEQLIYAAMDVAYLHDLRKALISMLEREDRLELAHSCFNFLNTRVELDLMGWTDTEIFPHNDIKHKGL